MYADDDVISSMVYEANLTMITLSITSSSNTLSSDARFEIRPLVDNVIANAPARLKFKRAKKGV